MWCDPYSAAAVCITWSCEHGATSTSLELPYGLLQCGSTVQQCVLCYVHNEHLSLACLLDATDRTRLLSVCLSRRVHEWMSPTSGPVSRIARQLHVLLLNGLFQLS